MAIPASQAILWVKDELENSLARVRLGWESYTQDPAQAEALERCLDNLHEIRGVLQVVGVRGGALLTQEIERVMRALKKQTVQPDESILEHLTRALMQLPMYLERVAGVRNDSARLLLPQINALRAAIGYSAFSDEDLTMALRIAERAASGTEQDVERLARKFRPQFQSALLAFYSDPSNHDALGVLLKIAEQLEAAALTPSEFELWWLAGGFFESVRDGGIAPSPVTKQLAGRMDRELRHLARAGESNHDVHELVSALRNQVLTSHSNGSRMTAIRSNLREKPSEDEWSASTADLSGPSQALLRTVGSVIREDLGRIKDRVDLYQRDARKDPTQLQAAQEQLKKVCDTLSVLGLTSIRDDLEAQRTVMAHYAQGPEVPSEEVMFQIASVLLQLEDQLDEEISLLGKVKQQSDSSAQREAYGRARSLVIREALVNLARSKQVIGDFVAHPNQPEEFSRAIHPLLDEIISALRLAEFEPVSGLIIRLRDALNPNRWHAPGQRLSVALANRIADAVVSIEYWLENMRLNRGTLPAMLDNAGLCVAALEQALPPAPWESSEETEPQAGEPSVSSAIPGEEVSNAERYAKDEQVPVESETEFKPTIARPSPAPSNVPTAEPEVLAVVQGSADTEIMSIFLEEAREVVRELHEFYENWQKNPADATSRLTIRRGFHTLKGSGRLIGAERLAEYCWKVESLLNRLIDSTLPATADRVAFVGASIQLVPGLIKELEQKKILIMDYDDRFMRAERLLSPATEEIPALVHPRIERALYDIYRTESLQHIALLSRWVADPEVPPPFEVAKAAHTLSGSSQMAQLRELALLCAPLDHFFQALTIEPTKVSSDDLERIETTLTLVRELIRVYGNRDLPMPSVEPVLTRWQAYETQLEAGEPGSMVAVPSSGTELRTEMPLSANRPADDSNRELQLVFLEEARDLLDEADRVLEQWPDHDATPENLSDCISQLQRILHTLKGGARIADIRAMATLSHDLESVFESIIGDLDKVPAGSLLQWTQTTIGSLRQMLNSAKSGRLPHEDLRLMTGLASFMAEQAPIESLESLGDEPRPWEEGPLAGTVVTDTPRTGDTRSIEPGQPQRNAGSAMVRVRAELLDQALNEAGEVSIYRSRLEVQISSVSFNLVELARTVDRLREQLRRLEIETEAQMLARLPQDVHTSQTGFDPLELDRYTRVQELSRALAESANDLSSLENLLSTLIRESETLLLQQGRINTVLQDNLMRGRLVAIQSIEPRLQRVVTRTATDAGKQARLIVQGTEAELDRRVLDRILAPLEHMVRNAVIHGLEDPDQRQASGKDKTGAVTLTFRREGAEVLIEVADDGAGLNLAAIRAKAIEMNLVQSDQILTDDDLIQMIFRPGFSTASTLTQTAGRGVGMDVVASEIRDLSGTIEVLTNPGRGTRIVIRLPFTLAISQSLLVTAGSSQFAIPLHSIEGVGRLSRKEYDNLMLRESPAYLYGGHAYQVITLSEAMGGGHAEIGSDVETISLILARGGDDYRGFAIDAMSGSREVVVKSLGSQVASIPGISGATILGDGSVVYILDPVALVRAVRRRGTLQIQEIEARRIQPRLPAERPLVLVVDDSITMRRVSQRFLERNGIEVMTARDGLDAIAVLSERRPDVALVDIEMPRMDGFELSAWIRNDDQLRTLPIVMITSRTGEKHRLHAKEIGVNAYLAKPYQEKELLETLHHLKPDRFLRIGPSE